MSIWGAISVIALHHGKIQVIEFLKMAHMDSVFFSFVQNEKWKKTPDLALISSTYFNYPGLF